MKRDKITVAVISIGLVLGIILYLKPVYAWEKQEVDRALREELNKINDIELRRAILDEYKAVLQEQMPELDIAEATCQACEYDLKKVEIESGVNHKPEVNQDIFLKDNAGAARVAETVSTVTISTPEVIAAPAPAPTPEPAPSKPPCGCG